MKRALGVLVAGTAAILALPLFLAVTDDPVPDPVTCAGYPEPRIYLENQSWWELQPGPPEHPGTGEQGHIHIGMCFPLYQTLTGDTLHLDVTIKLHNIPATPSKVRIAAYGDVTWTNGVTIPPCATVDCEYTVAYDFPLSILHFSGWREIATYLNVTNANGEVQRNWPAWFVFIDKPLPVDPNPLDFESFERPGGDSWYSNVPGGTSGQYARASIARTDVPWNEATGALTELSGVWTPTVRFQARKNFVYIDPALHANPPNFGTIVYDQTASTNGTQAVLSIDTTQLADGLHRLLIGTGNVGTNGTNSGVLVVPFLVKNAC